MRLLLTALLFCVWGCQNEIVAVSRPDSAVPDMALGDLGPEDMRADLPDLAFPDGGGVPVGCGVLQTIDPDTIICATANANRSQCAAETACSTNGWHLCTATEFRARVANNMTLNAPSWIASCIAENGVPQAPSDTICGGGCQDDPILPELQVVWDCSGAAQGTIGQRNIGITSSFLISRLGENDAFNCHRWISRPTSFLEQGALCCR